ncbi:MAG: hypothetical protein IJ785_02800 [Bacteroidales bacterium]|nr:hypothetical protein [Bacteroidales bacterium]
MPQGLLHNGHPAAHHWGACHTFPGGGPLLRSSCNPSSRHHHRSFPFNPLLPAPAIAQRNWEK